MRRFSSMLIAVFFLATASGVAYSDSGNLDDKYVSRAEYDKLKNDYETLKAQVQQLLTQRNAQPQVSAVSSETQETIDELQKDLKAVKDQVKETKPGTTNFHLTGYGFGGYTSPKDGTNTFSAGYNPILLYELNDQTLFEAEVEFGINDDGSTDTNLEYADVSYIINDYITVAAGKFLTPFGIFVLRYHPKWINKLPNKPYGYPDGTDMLVPESLIGAQVRGVVPLNIGESKINYALYVANGPKLQTDPDHAGELMFDNGTDNNDNKEFGGRIGFQPVPELEVGYSFDTSRVGDKDTDFSQAAALLQGADATYRLDSDALRGVVNFTGEYLWTHVDRFDYGTDGGAFTNNRWARYVQLAYRPSKLSVPVLKNLEGVFRFDQIAHPENSPAHLHKTRYTYGLDYWLNPNTVVKVAYQTVDIKDGSTNDETLMAEVATGF